MLASFAWNREMKTNCRQGRTWKGLSDRNSWFYISHIYLPWVEFIAKPKMHHVVAELINLGNQLAKNLIPEKQFWWWWFPRLKTMSASHLHIYIVIITWQKVCLRNASLFYWKVCVALQYDWNVVQRFRIN